MNLRGFKNGKNVQMSGMKECDQSVLSLFWAENLISDLYILLSYLQNAEDQLLTSFLQTVAKLPWSYPFWLNLHLFFALIHIIFLQRIFAPLVAKRNKKWKANPFVNLIKLTIYIYIPRFCQDQYYRNFNKFVLISIIWVTHSRY